MEFKNIKFKQYFCYFLGQVGANGRGSTYNGYTVDINHRLRQHNGFIKGGAHATRGKGPWEFIAILTSDSWTTISRAMQVEWLCRYPTRKKPRPTIYAGAKGRVTSLIEICKRMEDPAKLFINEEFYEQAESLDLPKHITLCKIIDEILNIK